MSVKKNYIFNIILLVSQYVFPLIIFPYISRVFGVERIGLFSFVDSTIEYFVMFSTMGIGLIGIREISRYKNDQVKLSKVFSELLTIHLIATFLFAIVYVILIFNIDKFYTNKSLFFIGISKLLFNVFLIEWFFKGIENFKYITIRSVLIKGIYVVLIFIFVKSKEDALIYFGLTCLITVLTGIVNFSFIRKIVNVKFLGLDLMKYLKSFFVLGLYIILSSMYTTFNIFFLGMYADNSSVGYYSTALKVYVTIQAFFFALNTVLMPRLSSFVAEDNADSFNSLVQKSIIFVSTFCFPIIMCGFVLAPDIVNLLAGDGFEGAITCLRIIIPLIFIVSIAQILAHQVLISLKKDKELLIGSSVGGLFGMSLNFILVPVFHEIGTSFVLLISEMIVTFTLLFFTIKYSNVRFPVKALFKNLVYSFPYIIICFAFTKLALGSFYILVLTVVFSFVYFVLSQLFLIKNELILSQIIFYKKKWLKN